MALGKNWWVYRSCFKIGEKAQWERAVIMAETLRILLVEDSANDALLIERQLQSEKVRFVSSRVDNRRDLLRALEAAHWDVILADFSLPQLDAFDIMEVLRREKNDTPIVLVTGTLPEERAVEFIKQGGQDFVLKSSLKRLPAALLKAIERRNADRERRKAEQSLAESEERLRLVVDGARDYAIHLLGPAGQVLTWNLGAEKLFGYSADQILGKDSSVFCEGARTGQESLCGRLRQTAEEGRLEFEGWLLRRDGHRFYANVVDTALRDETGELRGFSRVVRDITEQKRIEDELRGSQHQLRALAARLEAIREEESRRIAREIHDELGDALTALKVDVSWVVKKLPSKPADLAKRLKGMEEKINSTMRSVQRIATELRPRMLDELGLVAAVRWRIRELQTRTGIRCALTTNVGDSVARGAVAVAMFRILQEALTNVVRHARSKCITVNLDESDGALRMEIRDEGVGIRECMANEPASLGLLGMKERALLLGGEVQIRAAHGKGTSIIAKIPYRSTKRQ
jgi:two-component system sensor histidine kinase UhpB